MFVWEINNLYREETEEADEEWVEDAAERKEARAKARAEARLRELQQRTQVKIKLTWQWQKGAVEFFLEAGSLKLLQVILIY